MLLIWGIVLIFAILTIVFYMGKGAFLIAGYNTASKEEKDEIDEKKLCRVMGNGMLVVTLALIAQVVFEDILPTWVIVAVILMDTVYILIVGNTRCKRTTSTSKRTIEKSKKSLTASIAIGVVVFGSVVCFLASSSVTIDTQDTLIQAKASLVSTTNISYHDMKSVELKEDIDVGRRTNGVGDFKVSAGKYKNDEYGSYKLYSYKSCTSYIVITLKDTSIVVLNQKDKKATMKLYEEILTKCVSPQ